jgi:hypothetical protein
MSRFDFRIRRGEIFNIIQQGFDVDTIAFINRVIAAGGSLSATEQNAVNQLVLDLKKYNLWYSMKAVYPFVGASAAACSRNLIAPLSNGTFTAGWTYSSNGVNGNGTSAFFNTNLNQSASLSASNNHISIYSRTDLNGIGVYVDCGITNNTSYSFNQISIRTSGNSIYENGSQVISLANANSLGLYIGTSTSTTSAKLYKNGSSIGSSTTTQARTLFNNNIYIGSTCFSTTNAGLYFTTRQYAFASIGDGLNDAQASDLYTAVQNFQTSLGRQV